MSDWDSNRFSLHPSYGGVCLDCVSGTGTKLHILSIDSHGLRRWSFLNDMPFALEGGRIRPLRGRADWKFKDKKHVQTIDAELDKAVLFKCSNDAIVLKLGSFYVAAINPLGLWRYAGCIAELFPIDGQGRIQILRNFL